MVCPAVLLERMCGHWVTGIKPSGSKERDNALLNLDDTKSIILNLWASGQKVLFPNRKGAFQKVCALTLENLIL